MRGSTTLYATVKELSARRRDSLLSLNRPARRSYTRCHSECQGAAAEISSLILQRWHSPAAGCRVWVSERLVECMLPTSGARTTDPSGAAADLRSNAAGKRRATIEGILYPVPYRSAKITGDRMLSPEACQAERPHGLR
jgi:hypothetical protein